MAKKICELEEVLIEKNKEPQEAKEPVLEEAQEVSACTEAEQDAPVQELEQAVEPEQAVQDEEVDNTNEIDDADGSDALAPVEDHIESNEQASEDVKNGKKKRKRKKISDITFENDIRYRGPMSYRWLRIFAWVAIICAQSAIILTMGMKVDANIAKNYTGLTMFLSIFGTLSVPLFLMANFALIINAKNGYKRLIASYAFMALVIFLIFVLAYQRYILGIISVFANKDDGVTAEEMFQELFQAFSPSGFFAFNIFIDLFLCTLLTFFINYTPSKVFVGKKLIIFRLFVLIPVLYEIASFVLKTLCVTLEGFVLPIYVSPFLTTKAPITFLVFVVLSIFVKNRELVFLKRGKTREEYGQFLKTNTNSLHFSIAASICMIIAALLDLILYFVIGVSLTVVGEGEEIIRDGMTIASQIGFGKSIPLLLVIPFIMLFSYTRTHKPSSSNVDVIIPLVGMIAFAICYIEGLYQFILRLPGLISKFFGN